MKKIVLTESDRKKIISEREKVIVESFAKTFNKIKRLDESEVNEGSNVLFPDWLISKLKDVHTKVGQGSIFGMDVNKIVEIAKQVVAKEQNIEQIANSTGTLSTNVNGVGYDLVLPMEKAKSLPNAQIATTNKIEGPTTLEVPAVKTSASLQSFKTNELTIIVRPMKNDAGEVIPNGYIILSVFPGNPNIPRISEWNGQYAVIIPDQQGQEVNEVIDEGLLTEDRIDDFFKFLATDSHNESDEASVYYTAPVTMNKTIIGDDGIKIPNPMYGKLFKNTRFEFKWGDVYEDAVERINPEHEFGKRRGTYDKVEGFKVTEMGKSGLYLPILPTGSDANYSIMENGQWSVIDKDAVRKYLPPYRGSSASGVEYRQLIVDRIAMIKSGGNEWVNPHFKFEYLGPGKIE